MSIKIELKELLDRAQKIRTEVTGAIVEDHRKGVHCSANLGEMIEIFDRFAEVVQALHKRDASDPDLRIDYVSGRVHVQMSAKDKREAADRMLVVAQALTAQAEDLLRDVIADRLNAARGDFFASREKYQHTVEELNDIIKMVRRASTNG